MDAIDYEDAVELEKTLGNIVTLMERIKELSDDLPSPDDLQELVNTLHNIGQCLQDANEKSAELLESPKTDPKEIIEGIPLPLRKRIARIFCGLPDEG